MNGHNSLNVWYLSVIFQLMYMTFGLGHTTFFTSWYNLRATYSSRLVFLSNELLLMYNIICFSKHYVIICLFTESEILVML